MGWVKLTFPPLLVVPVHSPGFLSLESPSAMGDTSDPTENPLLLAPLCGFSGLCWGCMERKVYSGNSCGCPYFSVSLRGPYS